MTAGITDTAAEVRKTVAHLDNRLEPILKNMEATTASARDAFQQAQVMLGNLSHLSDRDSAVVYRIDRTMAELRKAATSLSALADYLNRHPEALLRGKKKVDGKQ
jgi:paraquat-inducible protein B